MIKANLLISWAFPVVIVIYLVTLARLASSIRDEFHDYWKSIGDPGLWDPNGQMKILKIVFLPRLLPKEIAGRYGLRINVVRILGIMGLVLFAVILLLIWHGGFN